MNSSEPTVEWTPLRNLLREETLEVKAQMQIKRPYSTPYTRAVDKLAMFVYDWTGDIREFNLAPDHPDIRQGITYVASAGVQLWPHTYDPDLIKTSQNVLARLRQHYADHPYQPVLKRVRWIVEGILMGFVLSLIIELVAEWVQ